MTFDPSRNPADPPPNPPPQPCAVINGTKLFTEEQLAEHGQNEYQRGLDDQAQKQA